MNLTKLLFTTIPFIMILSGVIIKFWCEVKVKDNPNKNYTKKFVLAYLLIVVGLIGIAVGIILSIIDYNK